MRTAAQIARLMQQVRDVMLRKAERLRLKREDAKDRADEDEMFHTGTCTYCHEPVGKRARWCRNCRRRALALLPPLHSVQFVDGDECHEA
jgi:hypothetical protein